MEAGWQRWCAFWDQRESGASLDVVRVGVSLVILYDLAWIGALRLPHVLWSTASVRRNTALFDLRRYLEVTPLVAWMLWGALVLCSLAFLFGARPRLAGVSYVLIAAQTALINDHGDRAIDRLLRIVVFMLALGATSGPPAWLRRTATPSRDGEELVAAWPRWLIVVTVGFVYWAAGLSKAGHSWWPWGSYHALYYILHDPFYARFDAGWTETSLGLLLTQLGTAMTTAWELSFPICVVWLLRRDAWQTASKGWRRRLASVDVRGSYLAIGVVFHLGLAALTELGIFPFAMLALYPAFYAPDELTRFAGLIGRWRAPVG